MPFEALGNLLIIIPGSIIVVLDFLALPFFNKWLKQGKEKRAILLLFFKPVGTLVCIYFVFTQFGGGFFFGALYLFAAPFITLGLFIYYVIHTQNNRKTSDMANKTKWLFILGGLAMIILLTIPPMLYSPIKEACAKSSSVKIPALSQAMNKFFSDHTSYPETLDELVPAYLDQLPTPSCNFLSGSPRTFYVSACKGEIPFFYTRTLDFVGFDFYEYGTGRHWRLHSFLDDPDPGNCP